MGRQISEKAIQKSTSLFRSENNFSYTKRARVLIPFGHFVVAIAGGTTVSVEIRGWDKSLAVTNRR
jgi:hypothetical protein